MDSDHRAGILFEEFAGATERLVFGTELLGTDPLVEMPVASCHRCRISIENLIRHHFTPWFVEGKPCSGMHGDAPSCEIDRKIGWCREASECSGEPQHSLIFAASI